MFATALQIQLKLLKHIQASNHRRVADYVTTALEMWPDKGSIPIDPAIWAKAKEVLKLAGYKAVNYEGRVALITPEGTMIATTRPA